MTERGEGNEERGGEGGRRQNESKKAREQEEGVSFPCYSESGLLPRNCGAEPRKKC